MLTNVELKYPKQHATYVVGMWKRERGGGREGEGGRDLAGRPKVLFFIVSV